MKNLILSALLTCSLSCFAQDPNPDLFQTWHLQGMFLECCPPLDLMDPPVYATLTISENLEFSGQGSCNTFTGSYSYDPAEDTFLYIDFDSTTTDCVFQYHNAFELEYFADVRGQWEYEIIDDGVGLQLRIYDLFELDAIFTNYTLSAEDFERIQVDIYPNPVIDVLTISSDNYQVLTIDIYTIDGKNVTSYKKKNQEINTIDLVHLDSGIYFLNILTDGGRTTKKIIKK